MVTSENNSEKSQECGIIGLVGWGALARGLAFWLSQVPDVSLAAVARSAACAETFQVRKSQSATSSLCTSTVTVRDLPLSQWDTALLCTRAPDLLAAARQWLPQLPAGIPVGVFSNGRIENELLILHAEFPQFLWRRGLVYFGTREDGDEWLISGGGKTLYGATDPYADFDRNAQTPLEKRVFSYLGKHGFLWVNDVKSVAREKWWLNTVLNTLCARWELRENRFALQYPDALKQLGQEAYILGEELDGRWPHPLSYYESTLHSLIQSTGANENSLARAMRLRLPHENDFLAGVVKGAEGSYPLLRDYVLVIDKSALS